MRGVPRDRRAISLVASVAIATPKNPGRPRDDFREVGLRVEIEPVHDAESRAERCGEQPGACGRANQRERLERHLHRTRAGPLSNQDVELEVLERGIEDLLDRRAEPVDLVDEKDFARLEVGQDGGQVAGLFQHRPGRRPHGHAHLVANDEGQGRLAEARRAVEEHVVERLAALARGGDRDLEVLAHAVLANVVVEHARAQPDLVLCVVIDARRIDDVVFGHGHHSHLRGAPPPRLFALRAAP